MSVGPVSWAIVAGGEPGAEELAAMVAALLSEPAPEPPDGEPRPPGRVPAHDAWGRAGRLEAVTGQLVATRSRLAALARTATRR